MIRKTMTVFSREEKQLQGKVRFDYVRETWWLLFIPLYSREAML